MKVTLLDVCDYDYIKNRYKLIAVDLSGQKDTNPKASQQIELKNWTIKHPRKQLCC